MHMPNSRCPHCGNNLRTPVNAHLYGSPFQVCSKCNQSYVDKRYHEIAIEGVRYEDIAPTPQRFEADRKKAIRSILIGIAILIVQFILAHTSSGDTSFSLFIILGVAFLITGIGAFLGGTMCDLERDRASLEAERQNSTLRLQDPHYVQQLISIGYPLKCPSCHAEMDSFQNFCGACGHSFISPVGDSVPITPSRIKPRLRKTITLILFVVGIAAITLISDNILKHNGTYTIRHTYAEYHGTLSMLASEHEEELLDFIYAGGDDGELTSITCTNYKLTRDDLGSVDIYDEEKTVYKEGLVQAVITPDEAYQRFFDPIFCITNLDSGHEYYFCSYRDVVNWIEDRT